MNLSSPPYLSKGFTLIELLIVLLIVGIVASFSVYSVNLVSKHNQNSLTTQLKNQIQTVQHKAQMFNFFMRIRIIENKESKTEKIIVEYFDASQQIWRLDKNVGNINLTEKDRVTMDEPFIAINPNGFMSNHQICINDECLQNAEK